MARRVPQLAAGTPRRQDLFVTTEVRRCAVIATRRPDLFALTSSPARSTQAHEARGGWRPSVDGHGLRRIGAQDAAGGRRFRRPSPRVVAFLHADLTPHARAAARSHGGGVPVRGAVYRGLALLPSFRAPRRGADAYLTPVLQAYVARGRRGAGAPLYSLHRGRPIGGRAFGARGGVGTGGGVVGVARPLCRRREAVLCFDLGGTSTTCRYAGTRIAYREGGAEARSPMLDWRRWRRAAVRSSSSTAARAAGPRAPGRPGRLLRPRRRGGDRRTWLGRLAAVFHVSDEGGGALDPAASRRGGRNLARHGYQCGGGRRGFVAVAVEQMARRAAHLHSAAFRPREHALVAFAARPQRLQTADALGVGEGCARATGCLGWGSGG